MDKALLVGIILPNIDEVDVNNHLDELKMLAETANVEFDSSSFVLKLYNVFGR